MLVVGKAALGGVGRSGGLWLRLPGSACGGSHSCCLSPHWSCAVRMIGPLLNAAPLQGMLDSEGVWGHPISASYA